MIISLGGGGSAKGIAAVKAVWPEGYSCICYLGTKKLRAKKGVTEWIFLLPELGTWTVEATDGTETLSGSVEISAEGQAEVVELSLIPKGALYYYGEYGEHGELSLTISASGARANKQILDNGALRVTINSASNNYSSVGAYSPEAIDLSGYSTLYAKLQYSTATAYNSNALSFGCRSSKPTGGSGSDYIVPNTRVQLATKDLVERTLDISGINGSQWVGVVVQAASAGGSAYVDIHELVLIP